MREIGGAGSTLLVLTPAGLMQHNPTHTLFLHYDWLALCVTSAEQSLRISMPCLDIDFSLASPAGRSSVQLLQIGRL